jgi:hypothetical protein
MLRFFGIHVINNTDNKEQIIHVKIKRQNKPKNDKIIHKNGGNHAPTKNVFEIHFKW